MSIGSNLSEVVGKQSGTATKNTVHLFVQVYSEHHISMF